MEYDSTAWSVETAGWKVQVDSDGIVSLLPADAGAALQFSHFRKAKGVITDEEVNNMARKNAVNNALEVVSCGDYQGYTTTYFEDGACWKKFYLYSGSSHLFVTFNSLASDSGNYDRVVDWILSSLKTKDR